MPDPSTPATHAIITPWSLSLGSIVTWCGRLPATAPGPDGAERLPEGALLAAGEPPTCARCVAAMRTARSNINRMLGA